MLFYLAVYERDINLLRMELVGAFNVGEYFVVAVFSNNLIFSNIFRMSLNNFLQSYHTLFADALRRVLTESVLPYLAKHYMNESKSVSKKKKNDDGKEENTGGFLQEQCNLEEYDTFGEHP